MNLNNMSLATDTANMEAGGKSFYDQATDAVLYGGGGALVSGLQSIANTAISIGNALGGNFQEYDTRATLLNYSQNWADYYQRNKTEVDAAGFVVTSLLPGMLGVKALRMAQQGKALGSFGSALGYTTRAQEQLLSEGLKQIASKGGTFFAGANNYKNGLMAAGAGQAMLETAAYEMAASVTMFKSPFLEKEDFGDMLKMSATNVLVGGALGGVFTRVLGSKVFNDAGKLVETTARKYDSIANLEKQGLLFGDAVYSQVDEVFRLMKDVDAADKRLPFSYRWDGKQVQIALDTAELYDAKAKQAIHAGMEKFRAMVGTVVATDGTVGQPLAVALQQIATKLPKDEAKDALGRILFNLQAVEGLYTSEAVDFSKEVVYLSPKATLLETGGLAVQDMLSSVPKQADAQGFRIVGDINKTRVAVLGVDARSRNDAFRAGFDWFIDKSGTISINPDSAIYRPTADKAQDLVRVYHPHSNTVSDSAIPTVGDLQTGSSPIKRLSTGVVSGRYNFTFHTDSLPKNLDSTKVTARHFWASGLNANDLKNATVQGYDFSVLDRLLQEPDLRSVKTRGKLKIVDDTGRSTEEILANFEDWLVEQKVIELRHLTRIGGEMHGADLRDLAFRLNTEVSWVEQVIAAHYDMNIVKQIEGLSRPLESYGARENLLLRYSRKALDRMQQNGFEPQSEVAYRHRVKEASENAARLSSAVLGKHAELFQDFSPDLLRSADSTGTGAGFITSSNADYGDKLRMFVQDTGKNVHLVANEWREKATAALRPSAEKLLANKAASNELSALRSRLQLDPTLYKLLDEDDLLVDIASWRKNDGAYKTQIKLLPETAEFLRQHHKLHATNIEQRRLLGQASGVPVRWDPDALYLPPIDTRRTPFFAFVRRKEGSIFGNSEVAMVTARDSQELQRLVDNIDKDMFDVHFKKDTEAYFKARSDYEYAKALNQPTLDPFLRKQGKLGDFMPSFNAEAHVEDFISYHGRKAADLARESVQVRYGQLFNELQFLSQQDTRVETSVFRYTNRDAVKAVRDPFGDYVRTALDISKQSEYTLWHQMSEFVDAVGVRAYRAAETMFQRARAGNMTFAEANAEMEKLGLSGPFFKDQQAFWDAQVGNDRNLIKEAVGKAHSLLANFGLRFDVANALVQTISTPILLATEVSAVKRAAAKDPKLVGALAEMFTVTGPSGQRQETALKMMGRATANFFSAEGKANLQWYKELGAVREVLQQYHSMVDDLSAWNKVGTSKWNTMLDTATEKIAKYTGNNFSEDFSRFVAADVMRQMSQPLVEAGKMTRKEQGAFITILANRVHGNYITSQRPIVFQGTVGAALGLFQTYQFNLFQQIFRHIANRDARTLAVATAMQSSIFGLSGLPMFEAINTHLIGNASMNEGHRDIYSATMQLAGPEAGEWLLYGTASAFPLFSEKAPALYTRGDLNPRSLTVLPLNPAELPVVQLGARLWDTVNRMGKNLASGADLSTVLLQGLEHQGISRPLAGMAQVLQGYSTTKEGNLAQANERTSISTMSRLLGARPMDESIALNANYRIGAYAAADKARLDQLGSVVKDKIRRGTLEEEDVLEFASSYAAAGGRADQYGAAMQRWMKNASQSSVNIAMQATRSERGRRLMEVMGADQLDDLTGKLEQQ